MSENDECLHKKAHAEHALAQLQRLGRSNGRMLAYPGKGHLLEPPYSPLVLRVQNPMHFPAYSLGEANLLPMQKPRSTPGEKYRNSSDSTSSSLEVNFEQVLVTMGLVRRLLWGQHV